MTLRMKSEKSVSNEWQVLDVKLHVDCLVKRVSGILIFVLSLVGNAIADIDVTQLVSAARAQIGVTIGYDPAYRKLEYPDGDVPIETGVCCDVVIRALRQHGLDLQKLVHEDMKAHFAEYPKNWGLKKPDTNIDHRRVPNLACYFRRAGWAVGTSTNAAGYHAGDIVTWDLGRGLSHIGIVSDRRNDSSVPLVIHNMGSGTQEEDLLFSFTITGHYRLSTTSTRE